MLATWLLTAIATADEYRIAEASQLALAHSVVARTTNDPDEAVTAALRGVQLARRSPESGDARLRARQAPPMSHPSTGIRTQTSWSAEARALVDRCVDPGIAGRYLARVEARHGRAERPSVDGLVEELTERELSVLRYLPSGLSQREIAGELYVSLNTVKTHCKAIYRKLGVDGRQGGSASRQRRRSAVGGSTRCR